MDIIDGAIWRPVQIDTVTIAEGSRFETQVTRTTSFNGESQLFCALVEELIQIKKRLKTLEDSLKSDKLVPSPLKEDEIQELINNDEDLQK